MNNYCDFLLKSNSVSSSWNAIIGCNLVKCKTLDNFNSNLIFWKLYENTQNLVISKAENEEKSTSKENLNLPSVEVISCAEIG